MVRCPHWFSYPQGSPSERSSFPNYAKQTGGRANSMNPPRNEAKCQTMLKRTSRGYTYTRMSNVSVYLQRREDTEEMVKKKKTRFVCALCILLKLTPFLINWLPSCAAAWDAPLRIAMYMSMRTYPCACIYRSAAQLTPSRFTY